MRRSYAFICVHTFTTCLEQIKNTWLRWPWSTLEFLFIWCVECIPARFWKINGVFKTSSWMFGAERQLCVKQRQMHQIVERQDRQQQNGWNGRNASECSKFPNAPFVFLILSRYSNPESKSSLPPEGEWTLEGSTPRLPQTPSDGQTAETQLISWGRLRPLPAQKLP